MARAGMALLEREEISRGLVENPKITWAELGRRVSRDPGTIAREVERNGGRDRYRASVADQAAARSRGRARPPRLVADSELRERVTSDLRAGFSPAGIAARLRHRGGARVCPETIYTAVYAGRLEVKARDCLRSRRPRRRHRSARTLNTKSHVLGVFAQIKDRPAAVNERIEAGHWEGDLIIGARNQSAAITLVERVTTYTHIIDLPNGYRAADTLAGLVEAFEQIPAHLRRSLTWDRGSEMACWAELAATYQLDVWFCDPHAPWQRGLNEHTNRQARWWLPRGLDLAASDARARIAKALHVINHQPRRSLSWDTPHQRYHALAR